MKSMGQSFFSEKYPVHWNDADDDAAAAEGWSLYDFTGGLDIQRIDGRRRLADDDAALDLVVKKAVCGSPLHGRALAIYFLYLSVPRS